MIHLHAYFVSNIQRLELHRAYQVGEEHTMRQKCDEQTMVVVRDTLAVHHSQKSKPSQIWGPWNFLEQFDHWMILAARYAIYE